jgi:hypothetical protein
MCVTGMSKKCLISMERLIAKIDGRGRPKLFRLRSKVVSVNCLYLDGIIFSGADQVAIYNWCFP